MMCNISLDAPNLSRFGTRKPVTVYRLLGKQAPCDGLVCVFSMVCVFMIMAVCVLLAESTIETRIQALQGQKHMLAEEVLQGGRQAGNHKQDKAT